MSKLHLVLSDRIKIEGMLNNGCSFAEIGRAVGKNRSTISREVQNHCIEKKQGVFNRVRAQHFQPFWAHLNQPNLAQ